MHDETSALELIERIYDAAVRPECPEGWEAFLEGLSRSLGGAPVALLLDTGGTAQPGFGHMLGLDPSFMAAYDAHYFSVDPYRPIWPRIPHRAVGFSHELLPDAELERSELFNDWTRPQGLATGPNLGAILRNDESGVVSLLMMHRRASARPLDEGDRELVRALLPHLERALAIHLRVASLVSERSTLAQALDRLPMGVLVVDRDCRVLRANRAADEMLRAGGGLRRDERQLRAFRPQDTRALHALVRETAQEERRVGGAGAGVVLVARPSEQRPLSVLATPVSGEAREWAGGAAAALLWVTDPERQEEVPVERLRRLHGLTRTEATVCARLAQGQSVEEIADSLGVAANTVRFHLKQVFAKTDTRRQAELVALIARSAPRLREDP